MYPYYARKTQKPRRIYPLFCLQGKQHGQTYPSILGSFKYLANKTRGKIKKRCYHTLFYKFFLKCNLCFDGLRDTELFPAAKGLSELVQRQQTPEALKCCTYSILIIKVVSSFIICILIKRSNKNQLKKEILFVFQSVVWILYLFEQIIGILNGLRFTRQSFIIMRKLFFED